MEINVNRYFQIIKKRKGKVESQINGLATQKTNQLVKLDRDT